MLYIKDIYYINILRIISELWGDIRDHYLLVSSRPGNEFTMNDSEFVGNIVEIMGYTSILPPQYQVNP